MTQLNIRITDPDVIRRVDRVREARGDNNITRAASKLLIERITQLEERGELNREPVAAESRGDSNSI